MTKKLIVRGHTSSNWSDQDSNSQLADFKGYIVLLDEVASE